jgi:Kef-type K+ transport system membrane component KefB
MEKMRGERIRMVATVGKLGGAMLTARMTGVNWLDSFALGVLMNTRGLIELIALNIGYDLQQPKNPTGGLGRQRAALTRPKIVPNGRRR